jgi:hypothetical protein
MEILRVPPYPITTTWDVPDPLTVYTLEVEDVVDHSIETSTVTSSADSTIEYILPRSKVQFDRDFAFRVLDASGEIVVDSNLTVYRPYVDPNTLGTTPEEIAEYKRWEIIARSIMDAYLGNDSATGEGFYNHKLIVQGVGEGLDYFPMWHNPKRILKVYENNVLVYDYDTKDDWATQYIIAPNNSAIMRVETDLYNRYEQAPVRLPLAYGDVGPYGLVSGSVAFPKGYDYVFILDVGYKAVPPDVEQAAIMLIDDLKCDRNPYYKRFVSQYSTDQYSIKYSGDFLGGTGNNIVDKILSGYKGDVIKPGVL